MGPADELTGLDQWLKNSSKSNHSYSRVMAAVSGSWGWLEKNGAVGGLPTLDFPELSMFGRCPWGGFGANPIPASLQTDWDAHGKLITGGMPYTEGLYLDMNQVFRHQQYAGAPRGSCSTGFAPRRAVHGGLLHGGVADLFNADVRSILMVLWCISKVNIGQAL